MDRVSIGYGVTILLLVSSASWAGTDLLQPPPEKSLDVREERFPESRFGQSPAKIDLGVDSGYAARAVEDMDRSPAGLVVNSEQKVTPVTPAASVTKNEINSNLTSIKGVQEVALIAGDLGFFPKTFFVARDVPVRLFITGASKNTLCIMMDSFMVRKQVRSQKIEEITFTPSQPGKYRYYCPVNGMEGTMIVKELASNLEDQ